MNGLQIMNKPAISHEIKSIISKTNAPFALRKEEEEAEEQEEVKEDDRSIGARNPSSTNTK